MYQSYWSLVWEAPASQRSRTSILQRGGAPNRMSFEVRNEKIEETMRDIGNLLKRAIPEGWGFSLFLMSYGEKGSTFYLSSIQRPDMVKALKEFIDREENKV